MNWQQLTIDELQEAMIVGLRRQMNVLQDSKKPRFDGGFWDFVRIHMGAAVAEAFACRQLGVKWDRHVWGTGRPDITVICADGKEGEIDVRWSEKRNDIKVKPEDKDALVVLGVRGPVWDLEIIGWVNAKTVKRKVPLSSPVPGDPAHFADRYYHQNLEKLLERIHGQRQSA